jgi:hypothetical protein
MRIRLGDIRARLRDGAPNDKRVVGSHFLFEIGRYKTPLQLIRELFAVLPRRTAFQEFHP